MDEVSDFEHQLPKKTIKFSATRAAVCCDDCSEVPHQRQAQALQSPWEEPEDIICPITRTLLIDPVRLVSAVDLLPGNDGVAASSYVGCPSHAYERSAIHHHWRVKGYAHDPLTNTALSSDALCTDWAARRRVTEFLEAQPEGYVPFGWAPSQKCLPLPPPDEGSHWKAQKTVPLTAGVAPPQLPAEWLHYLRRVLAAYIGIAVMGVLGTIWAAIVVYFVVPRYQVADRGSRDIAEEYGRITHVFVVWAWRALLLAWGTAHMVIPYLLWKRVRRKLKVPDVDQLEAVRRSSCSGIWLLIVEILFWATAFILLLCGHWKAGTQSSGYEFNMNLGGPIKCSHAPEDLGFHDQEQCDNVYASWMMALYVVLGMLVTSELIACAFVMRYAKIPFREAVDNGSVIVAINATPTALGRSAA